jgi:hypothetical protein
MKSRYFQVYFEVSKHLGVPISEVVKNKFSPDYRILIMKYNYDLELKIREAKRIEDESKKNMRRFQ